MTVAAVGMLLCGLTAVPGVASAAASQEMSEATSGAALVAEGSSRSQRDSAADVTRTIPAYLPADRRDRVVPVFSVRFRAVAGERRYVVAKVIGQQSSRTPDQLLLASASVSCTPTSRSVTSSGASRNVMRGGSVTLTPRLVYVAPRTGDVVCRVWASGLRPRPSSSGYQSANTWQVALGSHLTVSARVPRWNRTVLTDRASTVLDRGEAHVVRHVVKVGRSAPTFRVIADHKVTTCSAVGGSRDASTGGRQLCAGRVSRSGTSMALRVRVAQRARAGARCGQPRTVVSRKAWVGADVHHAMVSGAGKVSVSRAAGCLPSFVVSTRLVNRSGADAVVHGPSYRGTIVRR